VSISGGACVSCLQFLLSVDILQMEKSADVTPRKTSKLEVYLKETGLSQQEIAQKDGVSQESVPRVEQKLVSGLSLVGQWNGRCGRKRKSAARDDRQLVHFCKKKGK